MTPYKGMYSHITSLLAYVGATLIFTRSALVGFALSKLKLDSIAFLSCPMCLGFWVGFLSSYVGLFSVSVSPVSAFKTGLIVSMLSYLLVSVTDLVLSTLRRQNGL